MRVLASTAVIALTTIAAGRVRAQHLVVLYGSRGEQSSISGIATDAVIACGATYHGDRQGAQPGLWNIEGMEIDSSFTTHGVLNRRCT